MTPAPRGTSPTDSPPLPPSRAASVVTGIIRTVAAVTTGFGYATAIVTLPWALALVAVRRIAAFSPILDRPLRFAAAMITVPFGICVRTVGLYRIPADQPVLFLANHVNIFDGFVIQARFPRVVRGIELESHFHWPVYGIAMRLFGNVPIPHGAPAIAARRFLRVHRAFRTGTSILAFPEGHRTRTGSLSRFGSGVFRIAVAAAEARQNGEGPAVPIVPVVLSGAFARKRVGSPRVTPGVIEVRIGAPVAPETIRALGVQGIRTQMERVMAADLGAKASHTT